MYLLSFVQGIQRLFDRNTDCPQDIAINFHMFLGLSQGKNKGDFGLSPSPAAPHIYDHYGF